MVNISNLQVNSLNLDLNTLFSMIERETSPFASTILNIEKGSATINNFRILDIKAKDISIDFKLKENVLHLDDISANAYNGILSGKINYDFNHSLLDIRLIGKGLDIKDSLFDLCKIQDNLSGKMDITTSVSMLSGEYDQVIKSLNGKEYNESAFSEIETSKIIDENVEKIYAQMNKTNSLFYEELTKIYKELNDKLIEKMKEQQYSFDKKIDELREEFNQKIETLRGN